MYASAKQWSVRCLWLFKTELWSADVSEKVKSEMEDFSRSMYTPHTVSNTAPERAILTVSSLGVTLQTGQSGASEAQNCAFS